MRKLIDKIFKHFGYDKYECPNCKRINYLHPRNLDGIVAGYCRKCDHPIWNK
jgi:ribosomal protein L37AE/L43A